MSKAGIRSDIRYWELFADAPFDLWEQSAEPFTDFVDLTFIDGWEHYLKNGLDPKVLDGHTNFRFGHNKPFFMQGERRQEVVSEARRMIRSIPINAQVAAVVCDIRAAIQPETRCAVHIRRGDVVEVLRRPTLRASTRRKYVKAFVTHYADLSSYASALSDIAEHSLFLCTDDQAEGERAKERLAGRDIIMLSDVVAGYNSALTSNQRAFVEMLLMADAKMILGTGSAFCGFASYYGGNRLVDVRQWIIPGDLIASVSCLLQDQSVARDVVASYREFFLKSGRPDKAGQILSQAPGITR